MTRTAVDTAMTEGADDAGGGDEGVEEVDDPTDPLEVLGNELRMDILRALADADEPLSFTELRTATGVRDTGRFNYHLRRLCEYFVRETGGGYELGHAGNRVIAAGQAPADAEPPAETTEQCPVCGDADCDKLFHVHLRSPW